MNILFIVVAALLSLGPLIAIHEFGHYWVARRLGVKVLTYSIGFGPTILHWTSKKNGTRYQFCAIPLGGYVKMLDEREGEVPDELLSQAFNRKSPWSRMAIVAAGPLINLLLAVLLFWVLYLPVQTQVNTRISEVVPSSMAAKAGIQSGDRVIKVDGENTPSIEKLSLALIKRMGESGQIQLQVERDNLAQPINFSIPIQGFIKDQSQPPFQALGLVPYQYKIPPVIGKVEENSAAFNQGLQVGDRITAINGQPIQHFLQMVTLVQKSAEKNMKFVVSRNGEQLTLDVMPQLRKDTFGDNVGVLGVRPERVKLSLPAEYSYVVDNNPFQAMGMAIDKTWDLSLLTVKSIGKMLQGMIGLDNLSGPVTIAKVAGQTASMGWETFVGFVALMSVSLGILNLLPIPILDGGHLVYYFIEAIRGKPLSERVQLLGVKVGLLILGTMMLIALFNDFMRL